MDDPENERLHMNYENDLRINTADCVEYTTMIITKKYCSNQIQEIQNYHKYYIGVTTDPISRMDFHEDKHDMKEMHILCRIRPTNTAPLKARKLEMELLALYKGKGDGRKKGKNINVDNGGEEIDDNVKDKYYYVYCVTD
jgi:hypothetical protein